MKVYRPEREREREGEREVLNGDIVRILSLQPPIMHQKCGVDVVLQCSVLSADVYVPVINAINFFAHVTVTAALVNFTDTFYCSNEHTVVSQHCLVSAQSNREIDHAVLAVNIEYH